MSLTTRAVSALAVLSLAAIPVAALTLQGSSWDEAPVAAKAEQEPARVAADAPQQISHLVAQNITLDGDTGTLVDHAPQAHALVPQNPAGTSIVRAEEASEIETGSTAAEPVTTPQRKRIVKRKKVSKNATGAGSFQMLFQGPGK